MRYWYDTKEKRSWQMKIENFVGGIEDDIYHTGTCNNYFPTFLLSQLFS